MGGSVVANGLESVLEGFVRVFGRGLANLVDLFVTIWTEARVRHWE